MCNCHKYPDLRLTRFAISRRTLETPRLLPRLTEIARHPDEHCSLLRCNDCGQLWQWAIAWNWGARGYVYRVPTISVQDWLEEPFLQPAQVLIFSAEVERIRPTLQTDPMSRPCETDGCDSPRIRYSVGCLMHHITSMQAIGLFMKKPVGREFAAYIWESQRRGS